jgi:hypothetical protein
MADSLNSGVYESKVYESKVYESKVSPGSAVFEEILKGLRSEKEASDKKFDAAIAAVTALVPRDVSVKVNFAVSADDIDRALTQGTQRSFSKQSMLAASMSDSQKAVFMAVSRRAAKPSTIKAVARATKLKRDHVIVILSEITRRGLIKRVGRGLYARG